MSITVDMADQWICTNTSWQGPQGLITEWHFVYTGGNKG